MPYDESDDSQGKVIREDSFESTSGSISSKKTELSDALFSLEPSTLGSRDAKSERTASLSLDRVKTQNSSQTEPSLFDLDGTLFKKAKDVLLADSHEKSDAVDVKNQSKNTEDLSYKRSDVTAPLRSSSKPNKDKRVLAFKTVPKSKILNRPTAVETQKSDEKKSISEKTESSVGAESNSSKLAIKAQSTPKKSELNQTDKSNAADSNKPKRKITVGTVQVNKPEVASEKPQQKRVKVFKAHQHSVQNLSSSTQVSKPTEKIEKKTSVQSELKDHKTSSCEEKGDNNSQIGESNGTDKAYSNVDKESINASEQSHEELEAGNDDKLGQPEAKEKKSKWYQHLEKLESVDPLVDCLVSLTKHFDNPYSADGIRSGLPVSDSGMTPELFMRAANKVGFVTRFVKRPIPKIAQVLLPVVLLLEDNQACVLLEIDAENSQAKVFMPESGEGEVYLPLTQLVDLYTGYCFFIRPQFRFDKRSMAAADVQIGGKHWFWSTLTSSWRIYRDVIIASLLINLFAIASPLFVMNVYDRVVPNNAFDTLWVLAIGATVVYGFDFLLRSLRSYFIDVAGKKSDILMSAAIFSKVNNITMASRPRSVGAFAKNLQDFESIRDFITSASVTTLVDIPFMFLIVSIIYLIGGPVGFIPIITIIAVFTYSLAIQGPLKRSIEEGQKTSMQKNAVLIESLSNAEMVKLNNAQGTLQQQWEQAVGNISDWGLKTRQLAQSCSSFAMVAQQMTTVAMVVVGVYMIAEHEMSMGALVACVMLTGRALSPMAQFAGLAARYNHAKSAYTGLKDIMASPVEQPDDMKFVHRAKFDGSFEFDAVSFCYPEQEQEAVSDINLHIKSGEKVAIIGRIGSGKSTLGKLMMGLYEPKSGALRADGIDMRQINPVDLRRNVGAVSQDVSLFYGSIKDNICFGVPFIEDEAIIRAAELSGVSEFANRKASGLDSVVGERGQHLSGGQRQSVAIARALLFDPNILVLDEPTASMDNTTEARMRRRLANVIADKTLILITHKSSMLDLVDRVVVMDNGRILADGPKAHVLEALRQGKLKVS
ncbi:MAG: type I secretion system permease/ATPase [Marinomonas atlantica]|nr:type I secretion system permease/ATPase [Marinomonas atlantica]